MQGSTFRHTVSDAMATTRIGDRLPRKRPRPSDFSELEAPVFAPVVIESDVDSDASSMILSSGESDSEVFIKLKHEVGEGGASSAAGGGGGGEGAGAASGGHAVRTTPTFTPPAHNALTPHAGTAPWRPFCGRVIQPNASGAWPKYQPPSFRSLPSGSTLLRLHEEIIGLHALLTPTPAERAAAADLKARIVATVTSLWPEAEVKQFGSRSTGLELPESDVDLVVFGIRASRGLHRLGNAIRSSGTADHLEVISRAKVPIVKFRDRESRLYVDVCFEQSGGMRSVAMINEILRQQPLLRPLVVVLKYFLKQRDLNETYTGGVGSFLLLLMALRALQLHNDAEARHELAANPAFRKKKKKKRGRKAKVEQPKEPPLIESKANLGQLLLEFLEMYGHGMNFVSTGMSVRDGGSFFSKRSRMWYDPNRPFLLSVENPDEPSLDVGRNAYNIVKVRKAFDHARRRLIGFVRQAQHKHKFRQGSPLACVIAMDSFLTSRSSELTRSQRHTFFTDAGDTKTPANTHYNKHIKRQHVAQSSDDVSPASTSAPSSPATPSTALPAPPSASSASAKHAGDHADAGDAPTPPSKGDGRPATPPQQPMAHSSAVPGPDTEQKEASDKEADKAKTSDKDTAGASTASPPKPAGADAPKVLYGVKLRRPRLIADLRTRTERLKRLEEEERARAAAAGERPHWP